MLSHEDALNKAYFQYYTYVYVYFFILAFSRTFYEWQWWLLSHFRSRGSGCVLEATQGLQGLLAKLSVLFYYNFIQMM